MVISVNLFRLVHIAAFQCRSLAPVRYAARTVRVRLFFRASTKIFSEFTSAHRRGYKK